MNHLARVIGRTLAILHDFFHGSPDLLKHSKTRAARHLLTGDPDLLVKKHSDILDRVQAKGRAA